MWKDEQKNFVNDFYGEAGKIAAGARTDEYGPIKASMEDIAGLWSSFLGIKISAEQTSVMLALMKIARLKHSNKRDSYIDAANYIMQGSLCNCTNKQDTVA